MHRLTNAAKCMMMQQAPKMHHNEVVAKMHRLNNAAKCMIMQEAPKMHHNEVILKCKNKRMKGECKNSKCSKMTQYKMKLNERECIHMHVRQNALLLNARKCM